MSHHLDSPLARRDVRLDITDLYVFRGVASGPGEPGTVFAINVCHSIAGDIPTPGFHPDGKYEFKIDFNGDDVEESIYRAQFTALAPDGSQAYEIYRLTGDDLEDPTATGTVVLGGRTGSEARGSGGLRAWAGLAGDPFWIEPDVLHAVGHAFQNGTVVDLSGWDPARPRNLFAGHTVHSLVVEVPDDLLIYAPGADEIRVWAVASLATDTGGWRSINRVGLPMIHPLFTQFDENLGNALNRGDPSEDRRRFEEIVTAKVAGVVSAYGTAQDPIAFGRSVARRLLPNVLPYGVGTVASFGFGAWNGRSLTDNTPDVMFSTAANTPIAQGIGKESVTSKPRTSFPYVPPPPQSR